MGICRQQGRHTHMGRMGPTHGRKPKNSKKGRREAPIFVNGHLKGAVGPIRPWALANLVTALAARMLLLTYCIP